MGPCRNLSRLMSSTETAGGYPLSGDEGGRSLFFLVGSMCVVDLSPLSGFSPSSRLSVVSNTYERNFGTLASLSSKLSSSGLESMSNVAGDSIACSFGSSSLFSAIVFASSSLIVPPSSSICVFPSSFFPVSCSVSFSALFCNCCRSHFSYLLCGLFALLVYLFGGVIIEPPLPGDELIYWMTWDRYSRDLLASCLSICDLAFYIVSSSNRTFFFYLLYLFFGVNMLFVLCISPS